MGTDYFVGLLHYFIPLPVVLPLFAAGVKLALGIRWPRLQQALSVISLALVLVIGLVLMLGSHAYGPQVVQVGGWEAPIGITLVADRLSALMVTVSAAITLAVLVYSIGQGMAGKAEVAPLSVYQPTYLILVAGVSNAFLAGDLFNLYVGFEILLTASYVLLTLGGTQSRMRAGAIYVVVSLVSSVLFLIAIALVFGATGTVNMAQLGERLPELSSDLRAVLQVVLLFAFGIKAAVFPLAAWLPDSYPTAPAPVTAVFAGLLTKVGVYAIIRTQTLLFPGDQLNDLLMVVALATMIMGILGAVAQTDIKRLLSFTLISHIGYMVFGVALGSEQGMAGAVFYVAHHITVQTTLFLITGLIERRGGSTSLDQLGGLVRIAPILAVLFFVPAMNLGGIPPLSGFLGKLGLIQAGVEAGTPLAYALVGASVLTSLLTLYVIARVWNYAFWRTPSEGMVAEPGTVLEDTETDDPSTAALGPGEAVGPSSRLGDTSTAATPVVTSVVLPRSMVGATVALVVFSIALTVLAGPLIEYSSDAAVELQARGPYIEAVLGGDR
ncbi:MULTISPECIES: Na+/H+ antiporter subunit D [Nocardiopsis]|jgi:multicomponent Na+:H+ antiporter subunit D|uniref:NADH/Ubiquinone/plastoquinone (Complex I) n=1 Tax=Nocardiopsis dassonvillei (strain ATCC 23218 / DSM 43111 / CIP 107115 / JCM 7437 / KCTC 9190 / NBRC 14626 / NCTC 10488 / NRRL B-5397 / IMRU 509) TaxID=446468 RepID=D7B7W7_NOCDD|nr:MULTISPECIES: Na+/H+ antiporter subunit D [Nocardiopsis]ADH70275.1 NADH/Ubiquinone/plastoquinone (complex I) [Nocardiopsis dassonvillei subsp. dassonvillei DSM 43111]VEI91182.1 Multiple resistance and pH homeostasis protein D [Nocardiopsis dassonvillei]